MSDIHAAIARLERAQHAVSDVLMPPAADWYAPSERYARALDLIRLGVADALVMLRRVAEQPATEPPLQAVLAEIVAEGHIDWTLTSLDANDPQRWGCRSNTDDPQDRWHGGSDEEWTAWQERTEYGSASGPSPLAAAQARLAEIRELHTREIAEMGVAALDVPLVATTAPAES